MIAEFTALRSEITSRIGSQLTLILGAGTIVSAIIGVVVSKQADVSLLTVVPLVTSVLGFVHTDNARFINYIAKYIRDELWPAIAELAGIEELPSWERTVSAILWDGDAGLRTQNLLVMPFAYGFFGVVPSACLGYLAVTQFCQLDGMGLAAFILGAVLTILYIGVAIHVNRQFSWPLRRLVGHRS
ncbi:MAG TPA: hypothetical protein VFK14_08065 [Solirubrobacterales bacterium]|nr:hypothetical protein [Solirubrobacterales bacterium]